MSSETSERRSGINLAKLTNSLGIDLLQLDGNDVNKYAKMLFSLKNKNGPKVIEIKVKMLNNHHGVTPGWPEDKKIIDLNNGLILKKNLLDPAFISIKYLKQSDLKKIKKFENKYL
jgi:hypothetical protein